MAFPQIDPRWSYVSSGAVNSTSDTAKVLPKRATAVFCGIAARLGFPHPQRPAQGCAGACDGRIAAGCRECRRDSAAAQGLYQTAGPSDAVTAACHPRRRRLYAGGARRRHAHPQSAQQGPSFGCLRGSA